MRDQVADTMRASVLLRADELTVESRAVPQPGAGDVLVRVAAVGVCGSDVHYFEHGRIGDFVVEAPMVLGHEASGTIVAVGDGVPADRVGQRVSIEPQRPCRHCEFCRTGRYNLCPDIVFYATPPIDGAFAEYVTIPHDFAHPVGPEISDEAAALLEPLSVAVASCRKAGIGPGSSVVIAGAGPIGIVSAQTARAFGATRVVVSDPLEARRATALRLGATEVVDPMSEALGDGFDAFIDASGSPVAVAQGIRALRPAGVAVLVGMGADEIAIPVSLVQARELVVTGVFRYANTWPAAIELVRAGLVDLDALVTGRYGLDDVRAALDSTHEPTSLKSLVEPGRREPAQ